MGKKLVIYGDSNTWGYDPADWENGRYKEERCWPYLLSKSLDPVWDVLPRGLNGRRLPDLRLDREVVLQMVSLTEPDGMLMIMLGTNDLLQTISPDASVPAGKMQMLLEFLLNKNRIKAPALLITAPVPIGAENHPDGLMRRYYEESLKMNRAFARLAGQYGTQFADAAGWDIDMAYDYVHFSEQGHCSFAEHMSDLLRQLIRLPSGG